MADCRPTTNSWHHRLLRSCCCRLFWRGKSAGKCLLSPNCLTTVPPHGSDFIWLTRYLLSVEPAPPGSRFDQSNPEKCALHQSLKRICASSTFSHVSTDSELVVIFSRPRGRTRTERNEPETPLVRRLLLVGFGGWWDGNHHFRSFSNRALKKTELVLKQIFFAFFHRKKGTIG